MVVKKKQSLKQSRLVPQTEREERGADSWTVESITIHAAEQERKEQSK
jgi:hypothetical protein